VSPEQQGELVPSAHQARRHSRRHRHHDDQPPQPGRPVRTDHQQNDGGQAERDYIAVPESGLRGLAVRLLPTAQSARIRVRVPEVVTAVADADEPPGPPARSSREVLAFPLVGRGDLAGILELDSAGRGDFPTDERELAEVLAVLLTLSLGNAA
jgi:GAF domain-containing protein